MKRMQKVLKRQQQQKTGENSIYEKPTNEIICITMTKMLVRLFWL